MASVDIKPKSIRRAKIWSDEVENLYRFQQAGYRDEIEYKQVKQVAMVSFGYSARAMHFNGNCKVLYALLCITSLFICSSP